MTKTKGNFSVSLSDSFLSCSQSSFVNVVDNLAPGKCSVDEFAAEEDEIEEVERGKFVTSSESFGVQELNIHAWEAFEKGHDIHIQAAPSQAELLYKNYKVNKDKLKSQVKETIVEKYGNAASEEQLPKELLLGQSEREVEYDRAGRIIKGQEQFLPRSKYEEDVYINNHTCVWGSWWKDHQWGYKCCKQTI
ncbi:hypothetical protein U1Q18_040657 [Sarracenia purpurea var. burkii]